MSAGLADLQLPRRTLIGWMRIFDTRIFEVSKSVLTVCRLPNLIELIAESDNIPRVPEEKY